MCCRTMWDRRDPQAPDGFEVAAVLTSFPKSEGRSQMNESKSRFPSTGRERGAVVELGEDELEHVVGGLQRTWIEPPTGSDDTPKVEPSEGATAAGASLTRS